MKTTYRVLFALLSIPLLLSGCMALDELPDANAFLAPTVTLNDAAPKASSVTTILSAGYSSPKGVTVNVEDCGFYYGFNEDFSNAESVSCGKGSEGKFTANVSIKDYGKVFHYKAYISDGRGEILSDAKSYTIPPFQTHLSIGQPSMDSYTGTSATIVCDIVADEGISITERGICYGKSEELDIKSDHIACGSGTGQLKAEISGLQAGERFYACGYAKEGENIAYGKSVSLMVFALPSVITADVTSIDYTSAVCGGVSINDFGKPVTRKGVVWSTTANPTADLYTRTEDGDGPSDFTSQITGLTPGTTYYVRAYATNDEGTGYGECKTFATTAQALPELTTAQVSEITGTTAQAGGNVTDDKGSSVTARGIVWGTSSNPTVALSTKTADGEGLGSFVSRMTDLKPNTKYYVRAYATNGVGTAYGQEVTFTTQKVLPSVSTSQVTDITTSSAMLGGDVYDTGGDNISSRGIAWSTTNTVPTINDNKVTSGSGSGVFIVQLKDLSVSTRYYARAFAINSVGVAYGEVVSFVTGKEAPTVGTVAVSDVTGTSAVSGGNVTADGGDAVTARGVVWSTTQNPTTALTTKTADGTGTGTFKSSLTNLAPGTQYYVRAYATNSLGTSYGQELSFTTKAVLSTVITSAASSVTSTSATVGGSVTDAGGATVTERGVVWGTASNPTVNNNKVAVGSGTGTFSTTLSGLAVSTTYYVRAYAINSAGTSYGSEIQFNTGSVAPTVTTASITEISGTSAVSGGNVTSDGGSSVTARGVVWSTTSGPTVSLSTKTSNGSGTGSFTSTMTDLNPGTKYYVRAYATNGNGTAYGEEKTFTTKAVAPTVTTTSASNVTSTSATVGGNVTATGGADVTERGVVWSTSQHPTTSGNKKSTGSGTGSFSVTLTGLTGYTTYYVRAYAVNPAGTSYGNEISFTTGTVAPTVTTTAVSSIGGTTAVSGGNVTSDGGSSVTARGVVWSTTSGPTVSLSTKTSNGSGTGSFTSTMSNLSPGTKYYVRAYATNGSGTSYGTELTFITRAVAPTVTTSGASSVTSNSATVGGNVTATGGADVTERGVVWSTSQNPTTSGNKKAVGSGTGSFSTSLTGLAVATTYYVRAYAINSAGTSYGNEISFTTGAVAPSVTTSAATDITSSSATVGGNVTSAGGSTVTERGIVWSTTQNPTTSGSKKAVGSGTGSFSTSLTGLSVATTYYVRAYAINSAGTSYGPQISFTTKAVAPTVTTSGASSVTSNSATVGGNVTATGGADVTERGVVWSTSQNPTTSGNKKAVGSGTGSFSTSLTGLAVATTYYVRAYAINSAGTSYGEQVSFKTNDDHKENEGDTEDVGNSEYEWGDSPSGKYEYVDLGLSVKWATCNVGASKPEDYGDYFAWGEKEPYYNGDSQNPTGWKSGKSDGYMWSSYKYCKGSNTATMTKYCTYSSGGYNGFTDGKTVLDPEDDAAHVNWGGDWRMPTKDEFDELRNNDNCNWTWTTMNGVKGYKVVSRKSGYEGNYIFLPAAGHRLGTDLYSVGSHGEYWSSSLNAGSPSFVYGLFFYSGYYGTLSDNLRFLGQSVRPVCH